MNKYVPSQSYQHGPEEIINFEKQGPSAGPPMLFLHGFGASLRVWDDIREAISSVAEAYFLDLKGCGFSSKPKRGSYSMLQQAQIVMGFIRDRQLQDLTLVGHSYGGGVALFTYLLLQTADESHRVRRLILIDSAGYRSDLPFFISFLRIPVVNILMTTLTLPSIQTLITLCRVYCHLSQITWKKIQRYSYFLSQRGGRAALIRIAMELVPENLDELVARFKSIQIPALIIWGKKDTVIPVAHAANFYGDLVNSRVLELEDCGHVPQEEAPAKTAAAILSFLLEPK